MNNSIRLSGFKHVFLKNKFNYLVYLMLNSKIGVMLIFSDYFINLMRLNNFPNYMLLLFFSYFGKHCFERIYWTSLFYLVYLKNIQSAFISNYCYLNMVHDILFKIVCNLFCYEHVIGAMHLQRYQLFRNFGISHTLTISCDIIPWIILYLMIIKCLNYFYYCVIFLLAAVTYRNRYVYTLINRLISYWCKLK